MQSKSWEYLYIIDVVGVGEVQGGGRGGITRFSLTTLGIDLLIG